MGKAIIFASDNHVTNNQKNEHMKMKTLLLVTIVTLGLTTSTMAQNLPNYVPANGLVGWWPFNGNANDESGNGNNGTVNGATLTNDRFGNVGKAYFFNGSNNYITAGTNNFPSGNQQRTISIWFKINNYPKPDTTYILLNYGQAGNNNACGLAIDSILGGGPRLNFFSWNNSDVLDTNSFDLGTWHNLVGSFDGTLGKLYLDAQLIGQNVSIWNTIITLFTIGKNNQTNNSLPYFFYGELDDLGVWNRALSQEEIIILNNATNCSNNLTITPAVNQLEIGNTANFNATTSDTNPSYVWQSDLGQGFQTLNNFGNYSGVNSATLNITNVQLSEHNQPIRVITTSGNCVDTSNIAIINIADTCIATITDTTFITVTDTLIINTTITSLNPPNNSNTIKVFPNPTNDHITIDYGNFNFMNGYQLKIENSLGQQVFQTGITQQSDYLNLTTWGGNGLYFVHIIDPQGNTIDIRKIVLQ
jgi:hypothetical protein